jgi:chromosome partitioning protein
MAKIIVLYNHKGGVSKTTTSFNLAHAISAKLNTKVLLVDADPQCNLTELSLSKQIEALDKKIEETGEENQLPGTTILDALRPRFNGDRPNVDVGSVQLIQLQDPRVSLLRGDISLSEAEDILSQAHNMRTGTDIHQKRNYVAVHDMLKRLAESHDFTHIIIDVGPSAGALTRTCFLSADVFMIPVVPDRFNFQAVASLSTIVSKWIKENAVIVEDFKALGLNVPLGRPQFRGLIMQRYQRYAGEPKPAFKHWMERIPRRVMSQLLPSLVESASREIVLESCWNDPVVVEIPDFASLAPMMLTHGKPVWDLTEKDTGWGGSVWTGRSNEMNSLKIKFWSVVDNIER